MFAQLRCGALPALSLALGCALGAPALAQPVDEFLDMSVLPSSVPGWSYVNVAHAGGEAAAYSVSGGILRQTTMGLGGGSSGQDCYVKSIPIPDPTLNWVLETRLRVTAWEITGPTNGNERFAVSVWGSYQNILGMYPSYVDPGSGLPVPGGVSEANDPALYGAVDVSLFHTYRLEGNSTTGVRNLFIDGAFAATDVGGLLPVSTKLIVGDSTGHSNANAEYDYYHFFQVPSPSAIGLGGMSVFALGARRRRG